MQPDVGEQQHRRQQDDHRQGHAALAPAQGAQGQPGQRDHSIFGSAAVGGPGLVQPQGLGGRQPGQTQSGQQIGQERSAQGTHCRQGEGLPAQKVEGRVLLHAHDHPGRDGKVQPESDQEAGDQPQRRHRDTLFQQIPPQLPGRQAQSLQPGKVGAVLLRRHLHNGKDHEKPAHQHQQCRGVIGSGLLPGQIQPGVVVGQVRGKGQLRQALIGQNLSGLGVQVTGLVQGNAQGEVGGVLAVIIRHQCPGGLRRDPGAGFGEVGGAGPPAAQGKFVRMGLTAGIRPLERHRRADLPHDAQGPHGELVQGDLAGLLGQAAGGGDGQDSFGIVLVGHRQLHQPLSHHRVGEGADGTQPDGAFDVGMLGQ